MSDNDLMRYGAIAGPVIYSEWIEVGPNEVAPVAHHLLLSNPVPERTTMTEPVQDYGPRHPTWQVAPADSPTARPASDHQWRSSWDDGAVPWWVSAAETEAVERGREAVRDQATTDAYWSAKPYTPPTDDDSNVVYQGSWEALVADDFVARARQQGFR